MNSYTMETIARQRISETARHAEALGSRSQRTTSRQWARVAWSLPTIVHVGTREAR
jgi:hypothetical protein